MLVQVSRRSLHSAVTTTTASSSTRFVAAAALATTTSSSVAPSCPLGRGWGGTRTLSLRRQLTPFHQRVNDTYADNATKTSPSSSCFVFVPTQQQHHRHHQQQQRCLSILVPSLLKQKQQILTRSKNQQFSSSSSPGGGDTTDLIINAVGVDRLGIVSDISKVVIDCGGNVGESVAGRLGSHFSLMMLVTVPKGRLDDMKEQIKSVSNMNSAVFDTVPASTTTDDPTFGTNKKTPTVGYAGKFALDGADHPGIVHKVTSALAKSGLNIDKLHTEQELAPYGGAVLFKMRGVVVATAPLAKQFDVSKIKADLAKLGDSLNCEVSLDDYVDEKYQGSFYGG